MQKVIIQIDYYYYVLQDDASVESILNVFKNIVRVEREYFDGKNIYKPVDKDININIEFVPEENVRQPTEYEKENKKIKDLENSVKYKEDSLKKKDNEIENLKCKIKLLEQESQEQEEPIENN